MAYQLILVFNVYLSLTFFLGKANLTSYDILFIFGATCEAVKNFTFIILQAILAENCHDALKHLAKPLRKMRERLVAEEVANLDNIINDIETTGHFTGGGFFDVNKKAVTAMFGYTLTYLVILIQFKFTDI